MMEIHITARAIWQDEIKKSLGPTDVLLGGFEAKQLDGGACVWRGPPEMGTCLRRRSRLSGVALGLHEEIRIDVAVSILCDRQDPSASQTTKPS
jgi:hypothetical protein